MLIFVGVSNGVLLMVLLFLFGNVAAVFTTLDDVDGIVDDTVGCFVGLILCVGGGVFIGDNSGEGVSNPACFTLVRVLVVGVFTILDFLRNNRFGDVLFTRADVDVLLLCVVTSIFDFLRNNRFGFPELVDGIVYCLLLVSIVGKRNFD